MIESSLRDKRILVVDDEPQLRHMIVDVLRAEGFCAISQAGSVMEALAVFRETNPQLALLDVMLPDGRRLYAVQNTCGRFPQARLCPCVPYGEKRDRRSTRGIAHGRRTTTFQSPFRSGAPCCA